MAEVYNHKLVEKKWQNIWDEEKAFEVSTFSPSCLNICNGRIPVSFRSRITCRTSQTLYRNGYCIQKASYAGLQRTVSYGLGCIRTTY